MLRICRALRFKIFRSQILRTTRISYLSMLEENVKIEG